MKKFILKSILFCTLTIISINIISNVVLLKIKQSSTFKIPTQINKVFIGHSHPQYAYDDKIIGNSINLSYSLDSYLHSYVKLKKFLIENKNIKYIFIEYSNNSIYELMDEAIYGTSTSPKMTKYLPFLSENERNLILSKNIILYLMSKYNSTIYYSKKLIHEDLKLSKEFGRFEKFTIQNTDSIDLITDFPVPYQQKQISYLNLYYLKKIENLAHKNKIKLFLIRSPTHKKWQGRGNEYYFKKIKKLYFNDIEFLDFNNFNLSNKEFGDLQHLHYSGAKKLSTILNKLIKNGFLLKKEKQKVINQL